MNGFLIINCSCQPIAPNAHVLHYLFFSAYRPPDQPTPFLSLLLCFVLPVCIVSWSLQ